MSDAHRSRATLFLITMPRARLPRIAAAVLVPCTLGAVRPAAAQPASGSGPVATTVVRGTLVGGDGRPMRAADVALYLASPSRQIASASADSLGRFAVATTVSGPLRVRFSGVQHEMRVLDLLPAPGQDLSVDVRLHALKPDSAMDSVRADVARAGAHDTTVRLARGADGVFRGEVPVDGDTASVRIRGVVRFGAVVPDGATQYAPAGWTQYRAVFRSPGTRVAIAYDPRRLVRDTTAAAVRFRDTTTVAARLAMLSDDVAAREQRAYAAFKAQSAAGKAPQRFAYGDELAERQRQLAGERDPLVREMLLARVLTVSAGDTAAAAKAAHRAAVLRVNPHSPAWVLDPGAAGWMLAERASVADTGAARDTTTPGRLRQAARVAAYVDTLIGDPAVPRPVKAELLAHLVSVWGDAGAMGRADTLLAVIDTAYGGTAASPWLKMRYAAKRAIAVGRPLPAFRFAALGAAASVPTERPNGPRHDTTRAITPASLRGKTVLMDFWAVWCAPCVAELPNIQKAYAKYKARGLEVLSVSLDEAEADVAKFRRERQPMPWRHARAPGGFADPNIKAFEIIGIPRAVLVGPDGVVLAADEALRGDQLDATLARVLAAPVGAPGR